MVILIIAITMAVSLMGVAFYSQQREYRAYLFNSLKVSNRKVATPARFVD
ncbi:MAG: hypothetical protein JKY83_00555 [Rhizobiaceae bacterium]|nr:hypothetical protein [Rhizobiaceae bacterium]